MGVVASELKVYGAANIAETDSGTQGGAIDTTVRYIFDSPTLANTLADTIEMLSSSAGDTTQTVVVTGRTAAGSIVTENFSLNGNTVVNGATTFQRILKIVVSGSHAGAITVRKAAGDTTIVIIESGVLTVRRPFYNISADVSGGSTRTYYEKVFVKNTNATYALLGATFSDAGGDSNNYISFAIEDATGDSNTSTNRVTAPTASEIGSGGFSATTKTLAAETDAGTADLQPSTAIGVWLKLALPAGSAAGVDTWVLGITGSSI